MLVKVLKPFGYAPDVRSHVRFEAGEIADIDDSVIEGLEAEGFIGEASAEEIAATQQGAVVIAAPPVEIPADWAKLGWFKLRTLALALGAPGNVDKKTATRLIEAEAAARAELAG